MVPNPSHVPPAPHPGWRIPQLLGLGGLTALAWGLLFEPASTLRVFWFGFIPSLPLLLLVAPRLWRNACPLATLETMASRITRPEAPSGVWLRRASLVGIVMFGLLVPARLLLFETSATAMLVTVVLGVGLAVAAGLSFQWKSGFCNAFCPMLPVERLYGHSPLAQIGNGRCDGCVRCTPGSCFDLTPRKSIARLFGATRRSNDWLGTPFGIFVTAFPGIVCSYGLLARFPSVLDQGGSALARIATAYGMVALSGWATTVGFRLLARPGRWTWRTVTRASAALSAAAFYGLTAGVWASAWHLGSAHAWTARLSAWLVVGVWMVRARQNQVS